MPLRKGEVAFDAIYQGSTAIIARYVGEVQIWPDGERLIGQGIFTATGRTVIRGADILIGSGVFEAATGAVLLEGQDVFIATGRTVIRGSDSLIGVGVFTAADDAAPSDWSDDWSDDWGGGYDFNDDWSDDFG